MGNRCARGTWNPDRGSTSPESCSECPVGTFQPALGQANKSVCIHCAPGNFSVVAGIASCSFCPPGTWSGDFKATECQLCPQGKWSAAPGSLREGQCSPCWRSSDCLVDKTAKVTIGVRGLSLASLSEKELDDIAAAVAHS